MTGAWSILQPVSLFFEEYFSSYIQKESYLFIGK
jgi:hypothetical protein